MALSRLIPVAGAVLSVLLGVGCSSSSSSSASVTAPQDKGIDPGAGTGTASPVPGQGTEVNPYGVAYPSKNLGYQARAGNRPGSIMRNYKFLGYRNGDTSKTVVISLADYFDPDLKEHKVIHFSAGALWCPPCNEEAEALVPEIAGLKAKKVTVIQAIIEGDARGSGSTADDLNVWQQRHKINFTIFLDPKQGNLGQFFEAAAIPWNGYLDARSMEVLESGVGYNTDQAAVYDKWSKWIDANPAQAIK